jgi:hypothetical protein
MGIGLALAGSEANFGTVILSGGGSMLCRVLTAVSDGASGGGDMHCMVLTAVCGCVMRGVRMMVLELMVQFDLCRFRRSSVVGADIVQMVVFPGDA